MLSSPSSYRGSNGVFSFLLSFNDFPEYTSGVCPTVFLVPFIAGTEVNLFLLGLLSLFGTFVGVSFKGSGCLLPSLLARDFLFLTAGGVVKE